MPPPARRRGAVRRRAPCFASGHGVHSLRTLVGVAMQRHFPCFGVRNNACIDMAHKTPWISFLLGFYGDVPTVVLPTGSSRSVWPRGVILMCQSYVHVSRTHVQFLPRPGLRPWRLKNMTARHRTGVGRRCKIGRCSPCARRGLQCCIPYRGSGGSPLPLGPCSWEPQGAIP